MDRSKLWYWFWIAVVSQHYLKSYYTAFLFPSVYTVKTINVELHKIVKNE